MRRRQIKTVQNERSFFANLLISLHRLPGKPCNVNPFAPTGPVRNPRTLRSRSQNDATCVIFLCHFPVFSVVCISRVTHDASLDGRRPDPGDAWSEKQPPHASPNFEPSLQWKETKELMPAHINGCAHLCQASPPQDNFVTRGSKKTSPTRHRISGRLRNQNKPSILRHRETVCADPPSKRHSRPKPEPQLGREICGPARRRAYTRPPQ